MKKYLFAVPLVLLLCLSFACQDKAAMTELENYRAQAKTEEQTREFVKKVFRELNKGNVEILNELGAPEYLLYSPSTNPKPMSRAETVDFGKALFKAFPDLNWKIEKVFVDGNTAVIWNVYTGTQQGEFAGIPATGNRIEVSSILLWKLKDGKVVEEREEADMLGLMQQLGMELKPKAPMK